MKSGRQRMRNYFGLTVPGKQETHGRYYDSETSDDEFYERQLLRMYEKPGRMDINKSAQHRGATIGEAAMVALRERNGKWVLHLFTVILISIIKRLFNILACITNWILLGATRFAVFLYDWMLELLESLMQPKNGKVMFFLCALFGAPMLFVAASIGLVISGLLTTAIWIVSRAKGDDY